VLKGRSVSQSEFESISKELETGLASNEMPTGVLRLTGHRGWSHLVLTDQRVCCYLTHPVNDDKGVVAAIPFSDIRSYRLAFPRGHKVGSDPDWLVVQGSENSYTLGKVDKDEQEDLFRLMSDSLPEIESGIERDPRAPGQLADPSQTLTKVLEVYGRRRFSDIGKPKFKRSLIQAIRAAGLTSPEVLVGVGPITGMRAVMKIDDRLYLTGSSSLRLEETKVSESRIRVKPGKGFRKWWLNETELLTASPMAEFHRLYFLVNGEPMTSDGLDALPDSWERDPKALPVGYFDGLCLYHDRLIDSNGMHLPFLLLVDAAVDTAGSVAAVRGRDMGAKAASTLVLGPLGPFLAGNAKTEVIDKREKFLVIDTAEWLVSRQIHLDRDHEGRQFAALVKRTAAKFLKTSKASSISDSGTEGRSLADEIRALGNLRIEGLLSDEEFTQAKARLLNPSE
jgi:hypothetical protein